MSRQSRVHDATSESPSKAPSLDLREDLLEVIAEWGPMELLEKVGHFEEAESSEGAVRLPKDVMEQMFDLDFTTGECLPPQRPACSHGWEHRSAGATLRTGVIELA